MVDSMYVNFDYRGMSCGRGLSGFFIALKPVSCTKPKKVTTSDVLRSEETSMLAVQIVMSEGD
jgi:hypothetical protein